MHDGYLRTLQLRREAAQNPADRIRLQLFAGEGGTSGTGNAGGEGGSGGTGGDEGGTGGEGESGAGGEGGAKPARSFTQEDVNRLIQDTIAKERRKAQTQIEKARTEAERLASMTAEQRAQHEAEEREKALAQRESDLNRRELRATAAETLASRGLPASLLEVLDYSDADACSESINAAETAWSKAVQAGVEDRLKGKPPRAGGKSAPQSGVEAAFAKLNPGLKI